MYKVVLRKGIFKRTYKKVKGDLVLADDRQGGTNNPMPVRVLILDDNSRIELPMNKYIIEFSSGRHYDIEKKMNAEAGQKMRMKE